MALKPRSQSLPSMIKSFLLFWQIRLWFHVVATVPTFFPLAFAFVCNCLVELSHAPGFCARFYARFSVLSWILLSYLCTDFFSFDSRLGNTLPVAFYVPSMPLLLFPVAWAFFFLNILLPGLCFCIPAGESWPGSLPGSSCRWVGKGCPQQTFGLKRVYVWNSSRPWRGPRHR